MTKPYEGYDSEITDEEQRGKVYAAWTEFRDRVTDDVLVVPDINSFRAGYLNGWDDAKEIRKKSKR